MTAAAHSTARNEEEPAAWSNALDSRLLRTVPSGAAAVAGQGEDSLDRDDKAIQVWKFSARAQALSGSAIRDIVKKISQRPEVISFAGGLPSPATFPVDAIRAAFDTVLAREGKAALQVYRPPTAMRRCASGLPGRCRLMAPAWRPNRCW